MIPFESNVYPMKVFEALIPKGAEYYFGCDKDIVASKMKLIKEVRG